MSIIAGFACLFLTGCAYGTKDIVKAENFEGLEARKTTIQDIYDRFGQPHSVGKDRNGKGTVWRYYRINRRITATSVVTNNIPVVNLFAPDEVNNVTLTSFFFHADDTLWENHTQTFRKRSNQTQRGVDALTRSGEVDDIRQEMVRLGMQFDQGRARQMAWAEDVYVDR